MTNTMQSEMFGDRLNWRNWLKLATPLALTGSSLYLVCSALSSAASFLDKPIPTGSSVALMSFASGALLVAALAACGLFAMYLNVRFVQYLRSEYQAKQMAAQVLARICATNRLTTTSTPVRKRIKIAH